MAPSPSVARTVWPTRPTLTPAAVTTPAAEPWAIERDMTRIMSCPGVTIRTSDATTNSNHVTSTMVELLGGKLANYSTERYILVRTNPEGIQPDVLWSGFIPDAGGSFELSLRY